MPILKKYDAIALWNPYFLLTTLGQNFMLINNNIKIWA